MMNPFMDSKIQFKQQKVVIFPRFISLNSIQKNENLEYLGNPYINFTDDKVE